MEREPTQPTDDERIDAVIAVGKELGMPVMIGHRDARMIASQLHDGQGSALYGFVSTGRIDYEAMGAELFGSIFVGEDAEKMNDRIEALALYFRTSGDRGPVENWNRDTSW